MKIYRSVDEAGKTLAHGAVALGNFDGVHLGHQALIKMANSLKVEALSGVLTFSPHPSVILHPGRAHFSLTSDEEKVRQFARLDVDVAIMQKTDEEFLRLSPENFVERILIGELGVKHVVVGEDFSFGSGARGNVLTLRKLGVPLGMLTHVVPPVLVNGERCSSSAIRQYLRNGNVASANAMLDRAFSFSGTVRPGLKQGRVLGFPTANLLPPPGFDLCHGIYATITRVKSSDGHQDFLSATSIGVRPTIGPNLHCLVETHVLDQDLDLYDQDLQIFFIERLRPEIKFASLEALRKQIGEDCEQIRALHHAHPTRFHVKD